MTSQAYTRRPWAAVAAGLCVAAALALVAGCAAEADPASSLVGEDGYSGPTPKVWQDPGLEEADPAPAEAPVVRRVAPAPGRLVPAPAALAIVAGLTLGILALASHDSVESSGSEHQHAR